MVGERTNFHWWTRYRFRTNCDESLRRNAIVVVATLKYANTHTPERCFLWLNGRPFWLPLCKWKGVRSPFYSPLLVSTYATYAHRGGTPHWEETTTTTPKWRIQWIYWNQIRVGFMCLPLFEGVLRYTIKDKRMKVPHPLPAQDPFPRLISITLLLTKYSGIGVPTLLPNVQGTEGSDRRAYTFIAVCGWP